MRPSPAAFPWTDRSPAQSDAGRRRGLTAPPSEAPGVGATGRAAPGGWAGDWDAGAQTGTAGDAQGPVGPTYGPPVPRASKALTRPPCGYVHAARVRPRASACPCPPVAVASPSEVRLEDCEVVAGAQTGCLSEPAAWGRCDGCRRSADPPTTARPTVGAQQTAGKGMARSTVPFRPVVNIEAQRRLRSRASAPQASRASVAGSGTAVSVT